MRLFISLLFLLYPCLCDAGTYALVNAQGYVVNIVNWDGTTTYNPGAGLTAVQADNNTAIGGTYNATTDTFTKPVGQTVPQPVTPQPAR